MASWKDILEDSVRRRPQPFWNNAPKRKTGSVFGGAAGKAVTGRGGKIPTAPDDPSLNQDPSTDPWTDPNVGGGGDGGYGAALAAANATARSASRRQNEATRALADQQFGLIGAFGKQRDIKLDNIARAMERADKFLLDNYSTTLKSLEGNREDNEMAEADASFSNISNAVRERSSILEQAASQGAGETDLIRSQLQALRNYNANQGEVNRSFFDTLRSINNSVTSLNTDTSSNRMNIFNQAEADRESAWSNYSNQAADAWTQIGNIENSNTNIDSDSSEAYEKRYTQAAEEARKVTENSYKKKTPGDDWTNWSGKGAAENRELTSGNRAASINLGGKQKRPEGATLRKW